MCPLVDFKMKTENLILLLFMYSCKIDFFFFYKEESNIGMHMFVWLI